MKKYYGNKIISGASFDITFYAKNDVEAALKIESTPYHLRKYYFIEKVKNNDSDSIEVIAYGSRAIEDYGFSKEKTIFKNFEEFKKDVNLKCDKFYKR